jgi:predicted enzyme related to lactoylglutathione lyase
MIPGTNLAPKEQIMANQVVHFEIMGKDAPALRDFYQKAFDWKLNPIGGPVDYALVENAGIGGGIGQCPGGIGHVRFYVSVDDIDGALEKVRTLGAQSVEGPWPLPTGGRIASFVDPQGQSIGLVQS